MHTVRMYVNPPKEPVEHTDGQPADPPPAPYTYVIGFAGAGNQFDPMVATDTLERAIHILCCLNGGQILSATTGVANVMVPVNQGKANQQVNDHPGDIKRGTYPLILRWSPHQN